MERSIREHCEENLAKYALPYEYEFKEDLPKTLVGKIAYRELEKDKKEEQVKEEIKIDTSNRKVRKLLKKIEKREKKLEKLKNKLLMIMRVGK